MSRILGSVLLALLCLCPNLVAQEVAQAQWVKNRYFDFVGSDLAALQEMEGMSQIMLSGCLAIFEWPEKFPQSVLVKVPDSGFPQVNRRTSGLVSLVLPKDQTWEQKSEWITRVLLIRYGIWKGNSTPPPPWLVSATVTKGAIQKNPKVLTLLLRRLVGQTIPALAQRIQSFDRTVDPGVDYLIFRFLESGGLSSELFAQRLEQYWANGYDWSQLSLFFTPKYAQLNPAELELLWRTFLNDFLAEETAVCLSEVGSLEALVSLSKLEVLLNGKSEILTPGTWYIYRNNEYALGQLKQKQVELEVLAVSIHPYYFNACHSLNELLLALFDSDLEAFKEAAQSWNQDLLDAQQLSYETDRLLEQLCK